MSSSHTAEQIYTKILSFHSTEASRLLLAAVIQINTKKKYLEFSLSTRELFPLLLIASTHIVLSSLSPDADDGTRSMDYTDELTCCISSILSSTGRQQSSGEAKKTPFNKLLKDVQVWLLWCKRTRRSNSKQSKRSIDIHIDLCMASLLTININ